MKVFSDLSDDARRLLGSFAEVADASASRPAREWSRVFSQGNDADRAARELERAGLAEFSERDQSLKLTSAGVEAVEVALG